MYKEYKVVYAFKETGMTDKMNSMAAEGWQVIAVTGIYDSPNGVFITFGR